MEINFDFSFHIITILTGMLAWIVIGMLAYRMYKKQAMKLKGWKVVITILIGLFPFTINWQLFDTLIKIPILPLGVWILYLFKGSKGGWQSYRSFAWLGFFANFIFLVSTFVAIPVHHVIYPENEPSTYISNIKHAAIINIHPSAKNRSLNKKNLLKQIHSMRQETIYNEQWYQKMNTNVESNKSNERFPYQLTGTLTKWGSGLEIIIYLENDGKGILISTPKEQDYFRSNESLLEGGK